MFFMVRQSVGFRRVCQSVFATSALALLVACGGAETETGNAGSPGQRPGGFPGGFGPGGREEMPAPAVEVEEVATQPMLSAPPEQALELQQPQHLQQ